MSLSTGSWTDFAEVLFCDIQKMEKFLDGAIYIYEVMDAHR